MISQRTRDGLTAAKARGLKLGGHLEQSEITRAEAKQRAEGLRSVFEELSGLSALTLMSPQFTDAGLDHLKGLTNLTMLFLTSSKVGDKGLPSLKGMKNLQVLALSRTQVTDAGLDALKDMKSLKSVYLIGTKVTPQAVDKLKQTIPGLAVYK